MAIAGPLSSGGYESGFALQSTSAIPRRDAMCFTTRYARSDAPATRLASEALVVVSLVDHQLLHVLFDLPLRGVVDTYSRVKSSRRRPPHSIHKTPSRILNSSTLYLTPVARTPTAHRGLTISSVVIMSGSGANPISSRKASTRQTMPILGYLPRS